MKRMLRSTVSLSQDGILIHCQARRIPRVVEWTRPAHQLEQVRWRGNRYSGKGQRKAHPFEDVEEIMTYKGNDPDVRQMISEANKTYQKLLSDLDRLERLRSPNNRSLSEADKAKALLESKKKLDQLTVEFRRDFVMMATKTALRGKTQEERERKYAEIIDVFNNKRNDRILRHDMEINASAGQWNSIMPTIEIQDDKVKEIIREADRTIKRLYWHPENRFFDRVKRMHGILEPLAIFHELDILQYLKDGAQTTFRMHKAINAGNLNELKSLTTKEYFPQLSKTILSGGDLDMPFEPSGQPYTMRLDLQNAQQVNPYDMRIVHFFPRDRIREQLDQSKGATLELVFTVSHDLPIKYETVLGDVLWKGNIRVVTFMAMKSELRWRAGFELSNWEVDWLFQIQGDVEIDNILQFTPLQADLAGHLQGLGRSDDFKRWFPFGELYSKYFVHD